MSSSNAKKDLNNASGGGGGGGVTSGGVAAAASAQATTATGSGGGAAAATTNSSGGSKEPPKITTVIATRGKGDDETEEISYTDAKVIGNGSFGVVYQARLIASSDLVAIKKVLQDRRYKVIRSYIAITLPCPTYFNSHRSILRLLK